MLKITNYLVPERILILDKCDKTTALNKLADALAEAPEITDKDAFKKAIFEREKIISTGIGLGLAVPHARLESIKGIAVALGICREGIDYESLDDQPVQTIIMIAGPVDTQRDYLRLLAHIVLVFKNEDFRNKFLSTDDTRQLHQMLGER